MDVIAVSLAVCYTNSIYNPRPCRIELSNPSSLTVVCKRGSVEYTDTVRQRWLASSLRHGRG